jgi:two-component system chemotaxis response regulator CheB
MGNEHMESAKVRVLVIDDSLFMRTLISDMLNSDPEIEVIDTAKGGEEAIKKLSKIKPDCITLDLMMPGWDGLTTLKHIMSSCPTPVVILSAHSQKDADITMKCLNAGAVGFVLKPSGELSLDIKSVKRELLKEVKTASKVDVAKIKSLIPKKPKIPKRKFITADRVIVIGASTGGPQTLETILYAISSNLHVPIIIVQHMPSIFFTKSLAEHLNKTCHLEAKVLEDGEILQAGIAYLAPAGYQSRIVTDETGMKISLSEDQPNVLSPSIDITMKSAAEAYRENTIGVILTGIGYDGREGMKAIKKAGGKTIVQDETSLIFGMPKAVIDEGVADKVLPAGEMAEAITELVS